MFAPGQFGGQAAYVIVNGISMEPGFKRGDLVILHQTTTYQIGDIATYQHPEVGPIIHRIIDQDKDHFILKGDNNSWTDSYHPLPSEMIGKLWLHIPFVGKIIEQFRTPWVMALLAATIGLVFMAGGPTSQAAQPQKQRTRNRQSTQLYHSTLSMLVKNKTDLLFLLVVLALATFALALFAFTRPLTRIASHNISYEQHGTFSYSAASPPGIYTTNTVQTGEPIFRQLINQIKVTFDYQVDSDKPILLEGTYRLVATIKHDNGWQHALELQPKISFRGNTFSTKGDLDLSQVQALIDNLEQQTGLQSQQYTLTIGPEIELKGMVAEQEIQDSFSPYLTFILDPFQMQLIEDTLTPSQLDLVPQLKTEANTISILGLEFKIFTIRLIAVIGLILSLGGLTGIGLLLYKTEQHNEEAHIQAQYQALLVTVRNTNWLDPQKQVIEIATIEDLVKIAEREARMILYYPQNATHQYFVQDSNITYRYQANDGNDEVAPQMEGDVQ